MKKSLISLLLTLSLVTGLAPASTMQTSTASNPATQVGVAQNEADTLNLDSSQFGLSGPLDISTQYSQNYGVSVDAHYVQALSDWNAAGIEGQFGANLQCYGITFAQMLTANQRLKATVEHLRQDMSFNFAAGTSKRWIGQNAYGLDYQYQFSKSIVRSLDVSGYYAKANSAQLPMAVLPNGMWDLRHIAGGEDRNGSVGVNVSPWKTGLLGLQGNYDDVRYDTQYESNQHTRGLGATVTLNQLITQKVKMNLLASDRQVYSQLGAGLSYLIPTSAKNFWEITAKLS